MIKGAAICDAVGIGSSLTEYADFGKWLAVAGVLLLIFGLHRFGRTGPDAAIVFELSPPRKKKKKKRPTGNDLEPTTSPAEAEEEAER